MRWAGAAAGFLLLLALGCADSGKVAEVRGKVTVDGKPVPDGAITFFPIDGKGVTAGGAIEDGEYEARIPLPRGKDWSEAYRMKVSISVPKVVGMKKLYNTEKNLERPVTAEALPDRYNAKSELTIELKPGRVEKDFELKSK